MSGILPPQWALVDKDGNFTQPWYGYFKSADETWRPSLVEITTASTIANPAAHILPNHGVSYFSQLAAAGALTTGWVLELPTPGVRKTLAVISTSTTLVVTLPSTDARFRGDITGDGWKLTFPSSIGFKVIDLIGVTTIRYYVTSNPSGAVATT
jgi:hypothetical protein